MAYLPLTGIKVIDATQNVAGPYCGQILGDLGATVIKVEPMDGDDCRENVPKWRDSSESCFFMATNRNKRSIAIDLKKDEGRAVLYRLLRVADVFLVSLRLGTLEKLGIDYESVKKINPQLIYSSITGFGHVGPRRNEPCFEPIAEAYGGYMSLTGSEDGEPVRSGASINDQGTGMWAAMGVIASLVGREKNHPALPINTSLLETQLGWVAYPILSYLGTGKVPKRLGSAFHSTAPYQVFRTTDGFIMVAAGANRLWQRLTKALGNDALTNDPRFDTTANRVRNRKEMAVVLNQHFEQKTSSEWLEILNAAEVPCSPVNTIDKVVVDEQVKTTKMITPVDHPLVKDLQLVAMPVKFGGENLPARYAPPLFGQHSKQILLECGFSQDEVQELLAAEVIKHRE